MLWTLFLALAQPNQGHPIFLNTKALQGRSQKGFPAEGGSFEQEKSAETDRASPADRYGYPSHQKDELDEDLQETDTEDTEDEVESPPQPDSVPLLPARIYFLLGFEHSFGHIPNKKLALQWYTKAAQGLPLSSKAYGFACEHIAGLYLDAKDPHKAFTWLQRTAACTHPHYASYGLNAHNWLALSMLSYQGYGGPLHQSKAYTYFTAGLQHNPYLIYLFAALETLVNMKNILNAVEEAVLINTQLSLGTPVLTPEVIAQAYAVWTKFINQGEETAFQLRTLISQWSLRILALRSQTQLLVLTEDPDVTLLPKYTLAPKNSLEDYTLRYRHHLTKWAKTFPLLVRKAQRSTPLTPRIWNDLGYLYKLGVGTTKNPAKAFTWISKAASHPLSLAFPQLNLAALYYKAKGNPQLAYQWFCKALKTYPPLIGFFMGLQALRQGAFLKGIAQVVGLEALHPQVIPMQECFSTFVYFIQQDEAQEHRLLQLLRDWENQGLSRFPIPTLPLAFADFYVTA